MNPRSKSVWITPAACGAVSPAVDRPRAGLLRPRRQVGLQAQGGEARAGERVQARLVLADRLQQLGGRLLVQLQQLGLDLRVEEHGLRGRDQLGELLALRLVGEHALVGVEDVEERLRGEQRQLAQRRPVDARREQRAALVEDSRPPPAPPRTRAAGPCACAPPSPGAGRPSPASGGRRGSARSRSLDVLGRVDRGRRRARRRGRRTRARPGRSRRPRGCWRGTCCPAPHPRTRP